MERSRSTSNFERRDGTDVPSSRRTCYILSTILLLLFYTQLTVASTLTLDTHIGGGRVNKKNETYLWRMALGTCEYTVRDVCPFLWRRNTTYRVDDVRVLHTRILRDNYCVIIIFTGNDLGTSTNGGFTIRYLSRRSESYIIMLYIYVPYPYPRTRTVMLLLCFYRACVSLSRI